MVMPDSLGKRNQSQFMVTARNIAVVVCAIFAAFVVSSAQVSPRKLIEARSYDHGWEADMGALDLLSNALQNEPDSTGYIFIYGARRGYHNDVVKRMECMKSYLLQRRGIPAGSLRVIDGGYREHALIMVELWVTPKGSPAPVPRPTLRPKNVRFKRGGTRYTCNI
jgi:hypothetical protein